MGDKHPDVGLEFVHVISDESPTFHEIYRCHKYISQSVNWIKVISSNQYKALLLDSTSQYYTDPTCVYVLWHDWAGNMPPGRKARVFLHYSELIGEPQYLTDDQRVMLANFITNARNYDQIFVHTKWAEQYLRTLITNVHYAPVGFEPDVMGRPDYSITKEYDIAFYGSWAGRRQTIIPTLSKNLKNKLTEVVGVFGIARQRELNKARTIIHIPFTDNTSFTTMRLWHAVASSAVMLIEPTDTWPAIAGQHYIQIPHITDNNIKDVAQIIDGVLSKTNLIEMAKTAHNDLSKYTIKYCHDNYIIPVCK